MLPLPLLLWFGFHLLFLFFKINVAVNYMPDLGGFGMGALLRDFKGNFVAAKVEILKYKIFWRDFFVRFNRIK